MSANNTAPQRITVGVDGSIEAHGALLWAVDHARPGDTVHLLHAWLSSPVAGLDDGRDDAAAWRLIAREVARARCLIGEQAITVSGDVVHGAPGDRLAEVDSDLVVVGVRDRHVLIDALPGSVCRQLLRRSAVPVVVVPDRHRLARRRATTIDRVGGAA